MAHMGMRYGDRFAALADVDEMAEVAERDRRRIDHISAVKRPASGARCRRIATI